MSGLTPTSTLRKNAATKYPPEQNGKERRAGLITKADYLKSIGRMRAGSGGAAANVLVNSDRNMVLNAQLGVHLASNLKLRDDESAWDHNDAAQPGQVLVLSNSTITHYTAAAGGPPAALVNRFALSSTAWTNTFNMPAFHGYHNANQSIANNIVTALTFNSLYTNLAGATAAAGPVAGTPSTFTFNVTGWWLLTASIYWQTGGGGSTRQHFWRFPGGDYGHAGQYTAGFAEQVNSCLLINIGAGATAQLCVVQDSGTAVNVLNYAGSLPWVAGILLKAT